LGLHTFNPVNPWLELKAPGFNGEVLPRALVRNCTYKVISWFLQILLPTATCAATARAEEAEAAAGAEAAVVGNPHKLNSVLPIASKQLVSNH
jgi:hypothetical protein